MVKVSRIRSQSQNKNSTELRSRFFTQSRVNLWDSVPKAIDSFVIKYLRNEIDGFVDLNFSRSKGLMQERGIGMRDIVE